MNLKLDIPHNYVSFSIGFGEAIVVPYEIFESILNNQTNIYKYKEFGANSGTISPLFNLEEPIPFKLFTKNQIDAMQFIELVEN